MIRNAKSLPKRYYGMHMEPGVAEYREPGQEPERIFIGEDTIKNMDGTFECKPVYVMHVDEVDLANLQTEADGYVVKSFFNAKDGKHWAEFVIVSDKGHAAIARGWRLSNAYLPTKLGGAGQWHGVDYGKEVEAGEYEHLAIVPNPRYEDSIVLTPEEFKQYNNEKELTLQRIANAKENQTMLFFKRTKVENAPDLEGTLVQLPKSKKEMTLGAVINALDEQHVMAAKPQMANGDHHVMVGEKKMTVNELVEAYNATMGGDEADEDAHAAESEGEGAGVSMENEEDDEEAEADEKPKAKKNAKTPAKPAKKKKTVVNSDDSDDEESDDLESDEAAEAAVKKAEGKARFNSLKNAHAEDDSDEVETLVLASDAFALGRSRYGSGK